MKVHNKILELRKDNDLTQKQIAEFLNVSQSAYSKYENNSLSIPTDILIRLAEFYKVSADYIFDIPCKSNFQKDTF